jgi:hypothetical protein
MFTKITKGKEGRKFKTECLAVLRCFRSLFARSVDLPVDGEKSIPATTDLPIIARVLVNKGI